MIIEALKNLRPNAKFSLHGNNIEWLDNEQTRPTDIEIENEIFRLKSEYNAKEYQRKRATEYPPITEQLDKIFHDGIEEWKKEIQAIKNKYPKGE